jgi:alpha-amylase
MAHVNGVMIQYFQAYTLVNDTHWEELGDRAQTLAKSGFTAAWLPLSRDFDDATNHQYVSTIKAAHQANLQLYAKVNLPNLPSWSEWIGSPVRIDGFCLNTVDPIHTAAAGEWLVQIRRSAHHKLFAMGDYWVEDVESLHDLISRSGGQFSLFDVPLHYNFHRASRAGSYFDMRRILFGTLMREQPALAITFVENHHSQPLQSLESVVESWFKPLAYALILLRQEGYPSVFHGDYYGGRYVDQGRDGKLHEIWLTSHQWLIDKFLYARQHYAHGPQYDYFDHPECIGWTRLGNDDHPSAIAVILSNGSAGSKWMEVGKPHATFYDLTEHVKTLVQTNEFGWGDFSCNGGSVSVWVEQK